jgi:hypothetical protein
MVIQKRAALALLAAAAIAGCAQIIGFPDYGSGGSGGTGGAATSTSKTTSTSSTTVTSGATTTGGGGSATATTGAGGGCTSNAPCYDGPPDTEGVGACHAGALSCDGGVGTCSGEVLPSVELCSTPTVDENCDGLTACTGQFRWAAQIPGAATADAVAAGADGTVAVAGTLVSGAAFAYVDAFDAQGRSCWSAPVNLGTTTGAATALAVAVAGAGPAGHPASCAGTGLSASTVVAGKASGTVTFDGLPAQTSAGGADAFVALVDATGKVAWAKLFGSAAGDDDASAVAASANGYVYVVGSAAGALDLGCAPAGDGGAPSAAGAFVAQLKAADGTSTWLKTWPGSAKATGVGVDASGNVVVAGTFSGTVDFGSGPFTPTVSNAIFVARLGPDGTFQTSNYFNAATLGPVQLAAGPTAGGAGAFFLTTFTGVMTNRGGIVLCPLGPSARQADFMSLSPGLTVSANNCYSGNADVTAQGLAVDSAGYPSVSLGAVGGVGASPSPFTHPLVATGAVVLKIPGSDTDYLWSSPVSNVAGSVTSTALAADGLGNVVVAGTAHGPVDLGGETLDGGAGVGFVLELSP